MRQDSILREVKKLEVLGREVSFVVSNETYFPSGVNTISVMNVRIDCWCWNGVLFSTDRVSSTDEELAGTIVLGFVTDNAFNSGIEKAASLLEGKLQVGTLDLEFYEAAQLVLEIFNLKMPQQWYYEAEGKAADSRG